MPQATPKTRARIAKRFVVIGNTLLAVRQVRDGCAVLCEVKTINVSQDEAEKRQRIAKGEIVASDK